MLSRRAALTAMSGAASAVALSACGKETASGTPSSSIGVAMPTRASERWLADGKGIVENLEERGHRSTLVYGDDDPKKQVAQIEGLVREGVDVLVVAAIDNKSLGGVLRKAAAAKIPVISYDRLILGTEHVDYYVSFDNEQVGRLQALHIIDKLKLESEKGPFSIELFAGSADDNNTKYFFDGAMHLLQPYLDEKRLVVPSGQTAMKDVTTLRWDGPTAEKRMRRILTTTYTDRTVDAVLSPYDGISIGVLTALRAAGYGSGGRALPVVTGQDAELASVKSIIAGEQSQTVYKDLRQLSEVTAEMVDDILAGRPPKVNSRSAYNNGLKPVPAYLLQPESVDKSNYESVLVVNGYYTADELK